MCFDECIASGGNADDDICAQRRSYPFVLLTFAESRSLLHTFFFPSERSLPQRAALSPVIPRFSSTLQSAVALRYIRRNRLRRDAECIQRIPSRQAADHSSNGLIAAGAHVRTCHRQRR